jgi:hypothetical protein
MDRLLGSPEDLFVPVLCMEVNATCVSPAWISALVDGTGRSNTEVEVSRRDFASSILRTLWCLLHLVCKGTGDA